MRLFIATWPPATIVETLARLPRDPSLRAKWTRPDQWHVTLRFVGKVPGGRVAALQDAIDHAAAGLRPMQVELGPATETFGRHILHVPVAGLDDVAAAMHGAASGYGAKSAGQDPFNGHITLARTRRSRGGRPRGADLRAVAGQHVTGSWEVGSVCLVVSHPDPGGARYEIVHEAPLGGAPRRRGATPPPAATP